MRKLKSENLGDFLKVMHLVAKQNLYQLNALSNTHTKIYFKVGFVFFFWPRHMACEILVPKPGIEPRPPAVKVPSPNYCTAREFPPKSIFKRSAVKHYLLITIKK